MFHYGIKKQTQDGGNSPNVWNESFPILKWTRTQNDSRIWIFHIRHYKIDFIVTFTT